MIAGSPCFHRLADRGEQTSSIPGHQQDECSTKYTQSGSALISDIRRLLLDKPQSEPRGGDIDPAVHHRIDATGKVRWCKTKKDGKKRQAGETGEQPKFTRTFPHLFPDSETHRALSQSSSNVEDPREGCDYDAASVSGCR